MGPGSWDEDQERFAVSNESEARGIIQVGDGVDMSEILTQAPAIGIIAFLVIYFLRYLGERDKEFTRILKELWTDVRISNASMTKETNKVITETRSAVQKNTQMLGRVSEALRKVE